MGRDVAAIASNIIFLVFQSTRPVWGATAVHDLCPYRQQSFNPRAPCGARRTPQDYQSAVKRFQSTRPVWGATIFLAIIISLLLFQSTRPVWGATPCHRTLRMLHRFQSTRPVWGATHVVSLFLRSLVFQSTRPVWGATHAFFRYCVVSEVSIHAPRVGRDMVPSMFSPSKRCFNPRAPCGARLLLLRLLLALYTFQSTRPVWGATAKEVTTSLLCHVFMGIPLHKYDFLGTPKTHAPPAA